jgi:hypothetical protein
MTVHPVDTDSRLDFDYPLNQNWAEILTAAALAATPLTGQKFHHDLFEQTQGNP